MAVHNNPSSDRCQPSAHPLQNSNKDPSKITIACQPAKELLGQYAVRCAPTKSGDWSFMSDPRRIKSIEPGGDIVLDNSYFGGCFQLNRDQWDDHQWRGANGQEAPDKFLFNRCMNVSKNDLNQGTRRCESLVRSIKERFLKTPYVGRQMTIESLPDKAPLDHLLNQCESLRTHKEDVTIQNPSFASRLMNRFSTRDLSERMDTEEARCKRDVRELMKMMGNIEVEQRVPPLPPHTISYFPTDDGSGSA